jgi:predicted aconitase
MKDFADYKIKLTQIEWDILKGKQGSTLQRVMETVVRYGEALGAERLAEIEGEGHFVIPWPTPGLAPSLELLEELVDADLKTKYPFTLDPKSPLDFENLCLRPDQEQLIMRLYKDQTRYDELLLQLGLRDQDAYTCNPYLAEVGNIPKRGTVLAWSESACAIFANSVLGARTNRNGAIMDLLSNIVGKTPYVGLITDEGRRASRLVEVKCEQLPNPQLLGAAIGTKVLADVPFIVGIDRFLGTELNESTTHYLHEMGASCATYSAVSLFHVENLTPEARDFGKDLLVDNPQIYVIDDRELQDLMASYPVMWDDADAKPEKCFIGCPHISLQQLHWWANEIHDALQARRQPKVAIDTIICAAPQVLRAFKADQEANDKLMHAGIHLSATCTETLFENDVSAGEAIVTNSNKLRAYTPARFFPDKELIEIIVSGEIKGGS